MDLLTLSLLSLAGIVGGAVNARGYVGARLARHAPAEALRMIVILVGLVLSAWCGTRQSA